MVQYGYGDMVQDGYGDMVLGTLAWLTLGTPVTAASYQYCHDAHAGRVVGGRGAHNGDLNWLQTSKSETEPDYRTLN